MSGVRPAGHDPIHPPKREVFDLESGTNTDPKGVVRSVDEYRLAPDLLYMARGADHPRFDYVESWILPRLDLRVTVFHFTPGNECPQDFYVDVLSAEVSEDRRVWRTIDLYLDLICRAGDRTEVLDADELAEATATGIVDSSTAARAMEAACRAAVGIAAHGHDLARWLDSEGIELGARVQRPA